MGQGDATAQQPTGKHSNSGIFLAAKQFCTNMDVTGEFFNRLAILSQNEVFRELQEKWNKHIWEPNQTNSDTLIAQGFHLLSPIKEPVQCFNYF